MYSFHSTVYDVNMQVRALLGVAEVAEMAGVSRGAVTNWRSRRSDFPKPVADLRSGPIFNADEVSAWIREHRHEEAALGARTEIDMWVDKYQPLAELIFALYREREEWPAVEDLQRRLDRAGTEIDVRKAYTEIPRLPGEQWSAHLATVSLPMRVLAALPEARPLVEACFAVVRRAVQIYFSEIEPAIVRSDDPELGRQVPDAALLAKAGALVMSEYPSPTGSGSYGSGAWQFHVNGAVARRLGGLESVEDYFERQAEIIAERQPSAPSVARKITGFAIMPFGEDWSAGAYDMLQRAVDAIRDELDIVVYRADEISRPGKITDQIVAAIDSADLIIADITGANPNVMWELGYALASGRPAVILNQDLIQSPFDLRDWRQVSYSRTPTATEERKISEGLRSACAAKSDRTNGGFVSAWNR